MISTLIMAAFLMHSCQKETFYQNPAETYQEIEKHFLLTLKHKTGDSLVVSLNGVQTIAQSFVVNSGDHFIVSSPTSGIEVHHSTYPCMSYDRDQVIEYIKNYVDKTGNHVTEIKYADDMYSHMW